MAARIPVLPVPSRAELLDTFHRWETEDRVWRAVQAAACALLLVPVVSRVELLAQSPLAVGALLLAVFVDTVGGLSEALFQRALEVGTLPPDKVLGNFSGAQLQALVERVRGAMGPAAARIPVFIVAGKTLNAHAYHLGATFSRRLNAVYLNRALLHVLGAEEVVYILGHEFAHLCRFRLRTPLMLLVHLLTRASLAVLVMAWLWGAGEFWAVSGASVAVWLHLRLVGRVGWKLSQTVELLCDDAGARLCGTEAALRAEVRSGQLSELHELVWSSALRLRAKGLSVSSARVLAVYQRALPYGVFDRATVEAALETQLKAADRDAQGLSLSGFLEFSGLTGGSSRSDEQLDALLEQHRIMESLPRVRWPFELETQPDASALHAAVGQMRTQPEALAFLSPSEVDLESTHPSFRRRILYLWENAADIEAARKVP